MHWPVLFKKYSITVLFCGLLTITRAIDTSCETIVAGQPHRSNDNSDRYQNHASSSQFKQQKPPSQPSSSSPHHPQHPQHSQHSQHAQHSQHSQQSQFSGNGGHAVESNVARNSYAMLSQAMSQAVSHEFSK